MRHRHRKPGPRCHNVLDMPETLEVLVSRLERTAEELRAGELDPRHAAALVDDLARIAAEAGGELDRRVRLGDQPLGPAEQLAF